MARIKINKRKDTGAYVADYKDECGKRVRISFKEKIDAEQAVIDARSRINKGLSSIQNSKITFKMAAIEHMTLYVKTNLKPKTVDLYEGFLRTHLNPFFGDMKIKDIDVKTVELFLKSKIDEKTLSNVTINKLLILLGAVLERQITYNNLFSNPVKKVRKLEARHKTIDILDKEELNILLRTCQKHDVDFYPILLTAIMTGLRQGELLSLRWQDINFLKNKIHVTRTLYKGAFSPPKTFKSIRFVNIPQQLVIVLKEWRMKTCFKENSDLIFPTKNGTPKTASKMVSRHFNPLLKRAKLYHVSWHSLRHSYASFLIAQNIPIKYIQEQLGHSSIRVTMDKYGHLFSEVHVQGVNAFDNLLEKSDKNKSTLIELNL